VDPGQKLGPVTAADVERVLGLAPGDDAANVAAAANAAFYDSLDYGIPAGTVAADGTCDSGAVFEAIVALAGIHYQSHNRMTPEYANTTPFATNNPRRAAMLQIVAGTRATIA